ncbi:MAG: GIY-YIG nuclease family protein, partial [Erythrobacter sp.]|nr:GIY-YIG nuclease family protein [Erythrobacter sp.]
RDGTFEGFSKKYDVHRLVWFEQHATVEQAILREKQIKKWRRAWKVDLIEEDNARWRDLAEDFGFEPL